MKRFWIGRWHFSGDLSERLLGNRIFDTGNTQTKACGKEGAKKTDSWGRPYQVAGTDKSKGLELRACLSRLRNSKEARMATEKRVAWLREELGEKVNGQTMLPSTYPTFPLNTKPSWVLGYGMFALLECVVTAPERYAHAQTAFPTDSLRCHLTQNPPTGSQM